MIKVENLSVSYGKKLPDVLQNISFNLEKGNILNVLGKNATGKTTLIRTIMREISDYRGSIIVKGNEISSYSIKEYAKIVGVVSTAYNTYQNLLVADYLVTGFINQMTPFSRPGTEFIEKAYSTLGWFGKQELFNKQIDQLSSGEKQIVMIARVLLQNPEIIIFDEPTANLDVKNQITVLNHILGLSKKGYTIIVTTHNPGHAFSMEGKTLIMSNKRYSFGDTDEIITENILSDFYGLDVRIKHVENYRCMIFQDHENDDGIRLIF